MRLTKGTIETSGHSKEIAESFATAKALKYV
jgi:hypothetical protein